MPMEYRPIPFYHLDGCFAEDGELRADLDKNLSLYKKSGYGGLCPIPVSAELAYKATYPEYATSEYYSGYKALLDKAKDLGLKVIFYCDRDYPTGRAGGELEREFPESTALMLCRFEYECMEGQNVSRALHAEDGDKLMSLVAVEVDRRIVIDLREFVEDGKVVWTVPTGNWNIQEYVCTKCNNGYVNFMSYDACMDYISLTYKRFADRFADYIGDVVNMTLFKDLQYQAPNRRMWDYSFNDVFKARYGFDPSPYYPALWEDIGEDTAHYKALFMDCRAHMFADGFFKAVGDFTRRNQLVSTGYTVESKELSCDGFLWRRHGGAVGVDLAHSYMYGFNGLKVASSAAYNYDIDCVSCVLYEDYSVLDRRVLFCEAMNAFARGVNCLIPNTLWMSGRARIPHEVSHRNYRYAEYLPELLSYMTRCQTMLRGGRHIADIAMLYPIYSAHSKSYLHKSEVQGFEYFASPDNADYMTLINSIMSYSGRDLTLIHPDVMRERVSADDGMLYLNNSVNFEHFRVLIMPGMSVISIENLRTIKKFWDGGGKIIATVELPSKAIEFSPEKNYDDEVVEIITQIFGTSGAELESMHEMYENQNENGGAAYFLPSDMTGADGTYYVASKVIADLLDSLDVSYDVRITNMPTLDEKGLLNLPLPSFKGSGVAEALVKGGVFGYIHKKQNGCDVYFFANSSNADYNDDILLRGRHLPELWNPHNGKIKRADYEHVEYRGEVYTKIALSLPKEESVFVVSASEKESLGIFRDFTK